MESPIKVNPSDTPYFLSWVCVNACTLPSNVSAGASYPLYGGVWSITTTFLEIGLIDIDFTGAPRR